MRAAFLFLAAVAQTRAAEPGEEDESPDVWPFLLVTVILFLSMGFETVKGYIESQTPEDFEPITDAFFSELATLGFIGAIVFALTYNYDSSCEGACSVMQRLSLQVLGEPMELQEEFETLHFMLFAVSVVFIFVVLMLLHQTTTRSVLMIETFDAETGATKYGVMEKEIKKLQLETELELRRSQRAKFQKPEKKKKKDDAGRLSAAAGAGGPRLQDEGLTAPLLGEGAAKSDEVVSNMKMKMGAQSSIKIAQQARETNKTRLEALMGMEPDWTRADPYENRLPNAWWVGTFMEHFKKSDEVTRAEYVRMRHRFIDDEIETSEHSIPHDFDFGSYLKLTLAEKYAEIIELTPLDWGILWVAMGAVFVVYYKTTNATVYLFFAVEFVALCLALAVLQKLTRIRRALLPPDPPRSERQMREDAKEHGLSDDVSNSASQDEDFIYNKEYDYDAVNLGGDVDGDLHVHMRGHDSAHPDFEIHIERQDGAITTHVTKEAGVTDTGEGASTNTNSLSAIGGSQMNMQQRAKQSAISNEAKGGLAMARGKLKEKTEADVAAAKAAEQAVLELLASLPKGTPVIHGWLSKLNSKKAADPDNWGSNPANWRARLCLCVDGVLKYVSEKKAGDLQMVCDLINVQHLSEAAYPEADRPFGFTLNFFDGSTITFASDEHDDITNWKKEINRALNVHNRFSRSLTVTTGVHLREPPYQSGEVKCNHPDSWEGYIRGKLWGGSVSKHQGLFWFGAKGKSVMLHLVKLVLFISCVNISVFIFEIYPEVAEWDFGHVVMTAVIRVVVSVLAMTLPILTLATMPVSITYLNVVTCIEMMKSDEQIEDVTKDQKHEKHSKAMSVLSTLQFFIELHQLTGDEEEGDGDNIIAQQDRTEEEIGRIYDRLTADPKEKALAEELTKTFRKYDADGSETLDKDELGPLLEAEGMSRSENELDRLFKLMDASGDGEVDLKEFVIVMLLTRKARRRMSPHDLAEKLYALFDPDETGSIHLEDMLETLTRSYKNWGREDAEAFLDEIDRDGSGIIKRDEFVDYVEQYLGEQK